MLLFEKRGNKKSDFSPTKKLTSHRSCKPERKAESMDIPAAPRGRGGAGRGFGRGRGRGRGAMRGGFGRGAAEGASSNSNRDLSQLLCYLLRHGAHKEGLLVFKDGFVPLDDLLHKLSPRFSRDNVVQEVASSFSTTIHMDQDPAEHNDQQGEEEAPSREMGQITSGRLTATASTLLTLPCPSCQSQRESTRLSPTSPPCAFALCVTTSRIWRAWRGFQTALCSIA